MSLIPYYLQFVSEICEGKRPLPEGFALHETDDLKKAVELQTQIQTVGIPEFVRRCAAQTGESIPQADYDAFDPNDLNAAIAQLAAHDAQHGSEYLATLEALFDSQYNQMIAARALHIHRTTLIYRLQRISELTGLRMDDAQEMLYAHFSLCVYRSLQSPAP